MSETGKNYSPAALAYLGDAVYERLVREKLVREANRPAKVLHNLGTEKSRAAYQAEAFLRIAPLLTEIEADIARRGRNFGGSNVPKSSNPAQYAAATALETLFGYLALEEASERIKELFEIIYNI